MLKVIIGKNILPVTFTILIMGSNFKISFAIVVLVSRCCALILVTLLLTLVLIAVIIVVMTLENLKQSICFRILYLMTMYI